MAPMVRKQIYLTPDQDRRLRQAAVRQRRAEAEIVREALDRQIPDDGAGKSDLARDPLWGIVGLGKSGKGDLSRNVDHYLYGAPRKK
ncbi:MAG: hypothetical protein EXR72_25380 [Myxococcales bacterium]|nr:hypothetical protein [Myxococcales bacterium]